MCAIALTFYALRYIEQKEFPCYLICVILASTFHLTALIMLPVYYIANVKLWKTQMWLLVLGMAILAFYADSVFNFLGEEIISHTIYSKYIERAHSYSGVNIYRVLVSFFPPLICFLFRNRLAELGERSIEICVSVSIINALYFTFSASLGGDLTGRLTEYFAFYNLLLYPYIFVKILPSRYATVSLPFYFLFYLGFFIYQMYVAWGGLKYTSTILGWDF